jgi:hypothetical protein
VIWPHGENKLQEFLLFLNSIHQNIKFTMDMENNDFLPFLDVLVCRQPNGTLGHTVYRKPTHTDLYLHARSEHHPAQKRAILSTLGRTICDPSSLEGELQHLRNTLQNNGYNTMEIRRALRPKKKKKSMTPEHKPTGTAIIPYMRTVSGKISRLLFQIQHQNCTSARQEKPT